MLIDWKLEKCKLILVASCHLFFQGQLRNTVLNPCHFQGVGVRPVKKIVDKV